MATKKEKVAPKQEKVQVEPHKKSILEALKDNFKIVDRVTYIHRLIYIGEHFYTDPVGKNVGDVFEKIVKNVNERYYDERLTGFLLYYNKYFCHVIEGSEETLVKHLKLIIHNEAVNSKLGRLKLLIAYHHVNQRFLPDWTSITGKPPTLLEKLDATSTLEQAMSKVKYCIDKLYKLGFLLRPEEVIVEDEEDSDDNEGPKHKSERDRERERAKEKEKEKEKEAAKNLYGDEMSTLTKCLPEFSIIEYLLETQYTQDLRNYLAIYGNIPYLDSYEDLVWPVPSDFVPMCIFDPEVDPVTDLPAVIE